MSRAYRGRRRRRTVRGPVIAVLGALAALAFATTSAYGGYIAKVTNSADAATTNLYFTCENAEKGAVGTAAWLAYPFSEAAGTKANDISGNTRSGTYTAVGVTYGVTTTPKVCAADNKTVVTLNGTSGAISGPATTQNTNVFSLEIWFKTAAAQGKLIGFGSSQTGSSGSYDRHLYIGTNGKLYFGVYPGAVKTVVSPSTVTDDTWHHAVATLSSAGMVLYLDGVAVANDSTVTTAQSYNGYVRIGYDNLASWPGVGLNYYFKGQLAYAAYYTYALTADQVKAHYLAGD